MSSQSKYNGFWKRVGRLSLENLWQILSKPSFLPLRLSKISGGGIVDVASYFFPKAGRDLVENLHRDFLCNHLFFQKLNERFIRERQRRINCEGWPELVYVLIRIAKPNLVLETGVFDGISSSVILQALYDNKQGKLVSIDLPAHNVIRGSTHRMKEVILPAGLNPGWVIPEYLRSRHQILLGDSRRILPAFLPKLKKIDLFLHDSLHTFEHQWFEYHTVWPYLANGGMLLSDDVFWTQAFYRFCKKKGGAYRVFQGLGVLKKN